MVKETVADEDDLFLWPVSDEAPKFRRALIQRFRIGLARRLARSFSESIHAG